MIQGCVLRQVEPRGVLVTYFIRTSGFLLCEVALNAAICSLWIFIKTINAKQTDINGSRIMFVYKFLNYIHNL